MIMDLIIFKRYSRGNRLDILIKKKINSKYQKYLSTLIESQNRPIYQLHFYYCVIIIYSPEILLSGIKL